MKKRIMMFTAMAVMVCGIFAGCSKTQTDNKSGSKAMTSATSSTSNKSTASTTSENKTDDTNKKLSVVCTIFPKTRFSKRPTSKSYLESFGLIYYRRFVFLHRYHLKLQSDSSLRE